MALCVLHGPLCASMKRALVFALCAFCVPARMGSQSISLVFPYGALSCFAFLKIDAALAVEAGGLAGQASLATGHWIKSVNHWAICNADWCCLPA